MNNEVKYKVGDLVRVIGNTSVHLFDVGSVVKVRTLDSEGHIDSCSDGSDYWFLGSDEVEELKDAS